MTTATATADLAAALAHAADVRRAFLGRLETETRNRKVGPFLRLPMEETKVRAGGCVAITSHPFALVVVDRIAGRVVAAACHSGDRTVRFQCWSVNAQAAALTPDDAARLRPWGERMAGELAAEGSDMRAEVWAVDTLEAYREDTREALAGIG